MGNCQGSQVGKTTGEVRGHRQPGYRNDGYERILELERKLGSVPSVPEFICPRIYSAV
jgi:hypothetical protein